MGRDLGMSTLDQGLLTAIAAREIDPDDAYNYAVDKKPFQKYVTDTTMLPKVDITGTNLMPSKSNTSASA